MQKYGEFHHTPFTFWLLTPIIWHLLRNFLKILFLSLYKQGVGKRSTARRGKITALPREKKLPRQRKNFSQLGKYFLRVTFFRGRA